MYSINVLTNFRGNFHNIYSVLTVPSRAFIHKRIYLVLPANKTVWLFGNASNFQIYEKYLNSRSDLFVCLQEGVCRQYTIKSVPRNLVDTSSAQTQNVVQVCRCLHDAGGSSVAVLCAVLRE